jgi:predicted RecA/RadA family phage recombinase
MATNITNSNHMESIQWTNGGTAVSAGAIVVMGATDDATLGVALVDIDNGATGAVGVNCDVTVGKVSAAEWAAGESLIWDSSAGAFDDNQATAASGDVSGSCRAVNAGANTETLAVVKLTGIPGTLTA